jgi:hypothetical protein
MDGKPGRDVSLSREASFGMAYLGEYLGEDGERGEDA